MFSNVRVNQQIFVLDKANGIFEVGTVCEEPKTRYYTPTKTQTNQFGYPMPMQQPIQVVDLVIQTPTGRCPVQGLPMDRNFYENEAKTLFVTEDSQIMLNEFKTLKSISETHVKQTQYHQDMIGKYENWIDILNPEEAEKKRLAAELATMKNAYAEQTKINQQVIEQLQALAKQNEMLLAQRGEDKNVKSSKNKENA
ncbi:hypothetical protein [Clavibacter sp.]|uniref:hypothetical protein n=1 Tax=Clavibacter sp. TaxID=1871044 RepID=UPI0019866D14|nr:hypothetical protein [Clavibacter sp.]MBD5381947.1 hypothetical protein [Clavibacter sp.]